MNRTCRLPSLKLLAALLLASGTAHADIFILNSGDKVEGKVIAEDSTSITVEYQLTPKIKDKKVLNKADIKEATRFTPAQVEMEEKGLRKKLPTKDLMTASDYETIIQDDMRTFVAKFPGTPEAKEVEEMIKTLNEEKSKVLAGQIKMEGKWLDEETAKKQSYNIEAYRLRLAMKAKVAETSNPNNLVEALRIFDELKTKYGASPQILQAIPEALEILESYAKRLLGMAVEQPIIQKDREAGLRALQGPDLERAKLAISTEEATFKATTDLQAKSKVKWRDVSKFNLKSIQDAQLVVSKEQNELRSLNLASLQSEVESLNTAIVALAGENVEDADAALAVLRPDKARLINKKTFDSLEKELTALKSKKAAEAKASKATMAGGGGPDGTGADGSNPIAEALKKKEEAKKKAAEEKAAKEKEREAARLAEAKRIAELPPLEPTLMEKINEYIPYIGGGLLLILIIAMVLGKKKKGDDD